MRNCQAFIRSKCSTSPGQDVSVPEAGGAKQEGKGLGLGETEEEWEKGT